MKSSDFAWTEERVDLLKKSWADGKSTTLIVEELGGGLTRSAVCGKISRLGLQKRQGKRSAVLAVKRPYKARTPQRPFKLDAARFLKDITEPSTDLPSDQSANPRTIMELKSHHCRWPLGEPSVDMLYCGDPIAEGSYCWRHAGIAYRGGAITQWNEKERKRKATAAVMEEEIPAFDRQYRNKRTKTWTRFPFGGEAA